VDDSNKEYVASIRCSVKHQAWPPTDHFERLLEEADPNHAYSINHKLKDCAMMKIFMTSGSLTRDKEPEEDQGGRGVTPFPGEEMVTTVYDGRPLPGGIVCLTSVLGPLLAAVRDSGTQGYIYIYSQNMLRI
jgi:hypothetical protein